MVNKLFVRLVLGKKNKFVVLARPLITEKCTQQLLNEITLNNKMAWNNTLFHFNRLIIIPTHSPVTNKGFFGVRRELYISCVSFRMLYKRTKQMMELKYLCNAPIQNGSQKGVWISTQNNDCQSDCFRVIKNYLYILFQ